MGTKGSWPEDSKVEPADSTWYKSTAVRHAAAVPFVPDVLVMFDDGAAAWDLAGIRKSAAQVAAHEYAALTGNGHTADGHYHDFFALRAPQLGLWDYPCQHWPDAEFPAPWYCRDQPALGPVDSAFGGIGIYDATIVFGWNGTEPCRFTHSHGDSEWVLFSKCLNERAAGLNRPGMYIAPWMSFLYDMDYYVLKPDGLKASEPILFDRGKYPSSSQWTQTHRDGKEPVEDWSQGASIFQVRLDCAAFDGRKPVFR